MELSSSTLDVLKNFAGINSNIVLEEGNVLKTVSEAKNVLSTAVLDDSFPRKFGLYDLNMFLSVMNLVDSPRIMFEDDYAIISDTSGRSKIKYYSSPSDMLTKPEKEIIMPETEVNFTLDHATLSKVKRAASVMGYTNMTVTNRDGMVVLNVIDNNDPTSNVFSIDVDGTFEGTNFNFVFNISNLKMIDGDYEVGISSRLISQFVNTKSNIKYWVALEKQSTYEV